MFIEPDKNDVYIGDSVYLQHDPGGAVGIAIYTYDGNDIGDEIFLEPEVLVRFVKELERMVAE
jgi:hypothetical protein